MCTAVSFHSGEHYFGRTLDYGCGYGESVVITPRRFPFRWRNGGVNDAHYAMIGVAHPTDTMPLYYDAVNEKGLCAAGLRFAESARYGKGAGERAVASFEWIPWVRSVAASVEEARELLRGVTVTDEAFSAELPPSPLHFLLADATACMTVEPVKEGLKLYDNPFGVLANEPPFPVMTAEMAARAPLSFGEHMPGDGTSPARFARAYCARRDALAGQDEAESVSQMFHVLGTVEQVAGCARTGGVLDYRTRYTACCNAARGIYYYTTYHCRSVVSVELWGEEPEGTVPVGYPMLERGCVYRQNG